MLIKKLSALLLSASLLICTVPHVSAEENPEPLRAGRTAARMIELTDEQREHIPVYTSNKLNRKGSTYIEKQQKHSSYYYDQLNDNEKDFYNRLYNAALEQGYSNRDFDLETFDNGEKYGAICSVYYPSLSLSKAISVFVAFFYDSPELFWLENAYSAENGYFTIYCNEFLSYSSNRSEYRSQIYDKLEEVKAIADKGDNDLEKLCLAAEHLNSTVKYDGRAKNNQNAQARSLTRNVSATASLWPCTGYSTTSV